MFVVHPSNHTAICASKHWLYNKFDALYAQVPTERFVISTDFPIRFLKDGCWRKATDGVDFCSQDAFFGFKSDKDLGMSSTKFVPIRIAVVVKETLSESLVEKLVLLTSKTQLMVAVSADKIFGRNSFANNRLNTLVLAVPEENPQIVLNVFPKNKPPRQYFIRYNEAAKKFDIPNGMKIGWNQEDEYDKDTQSNVPTGFEASCLALAKVYQFDTLDRVSNVAARNIPANLNCNVCLGAHHSASCERGDVTQCFECHLKIGNVNDHASACSVKHWFLSSPVERYMNMLSTRCFFSFQSPVWVLLNGKLSLPTPGMLLVSSMCDSYFKFESSKKFSLMTSGYTRVRLPIILQENSDRFVEKIIVMTSHDRAIVVAKGSRLVTENNVLEDYQHNTPLILYMLENPEKFTVEVHGSGGRKVAHEISYDQYEKKFRIPPELDLKSKNTEAMTFDAVLPPKIKRK